MRYKRGAVWRLPRQKRKLRCGNTASMKKLPSAQHKHLRLTSHPTNASTLAETIIVAGPTLIGCFVASSASPHRGSRLKFCFASTVRWHDLTSASGPLHPQDASTRGEMKISKRLA
jgi:hypothetical protein